MLRSMPIREADDFLPGHNICANGVQCDQYGIVPYEYVPFAQPGYWDPLPTLPQDSFYDEVSRTRTHTHTAALSSSTRARPMCLCALTFTLVSHTHIMYSSTTRMLWKPSSRHRAH